MTPRTAPKPVESTVPPSLHTIHGSNRIQKPKKIDARLQKTRSDRLADMALREVCFSSVGDYRAVTD